jgi:hypothetical protein
MPVDPEVRRLAADPEVIFAIRMIDCYFERIAARKDVGPVTAEATAEETIETGWRLMKRGILRLHDPEVDDDDDPFIRGTVTSGQRDRARVVGAKLYAVRQYLRRLQNAKMGGKAAPRSGLRRWSAAPATHSRDT